MLSYSHQTICHFITMPLKYKFLYSPQALTQGNKVLDKFSQHLGMLQGETLEKLISENKAKASHVGF